MNLLNETKLCNVYFCVMLQFWSPYDQGTLNHHCAAYDTLDPGTCDPE